MGFVVEVQQVRPVQMVAIMFTLLGHLIHL
jgi:hypothetical protein